METINISRSVAVCGLTLINPQVGGDSTDQMVLCPSVFIPIGFVIIRKNVSSFYKNLLTTWFTSN